MTDDFACFDFPIKPHWTCQHCETLVERGKEHECEVVGARRLWRVLQRRFDDRGDYWSLIKLAHASSAASAVGEVLLSIQADCEAFCASDLKRRTES